MQPVRGAERSIANITRKRFFTGMNTLVQFQSEVVRKRLTANGTDEIPLASVYFRVPHQIAATRERLAADEAFGILLAVMHLQIVSLQGAVVRKRSTTFIAFEFGFSTVDFQVRFQTATPRVGLTAYLTNIVSFDWVILIMYLLMVV